MKILHLRSQDILASILPSILEEIEQKCVRVWSNSFHIPLSKPATELYNETRIHQQRTASCVHMATVLRKCLGKNVEVRFLS